jgi:anti-sigma factor RsiW
MNDMAERLSNEEMAELSALADGSLRADRRAEVEARIAASAELQEALARQRRAILATQALAADEVPASLQAAVGGRPRRGTLRRPVPRFALAAAAAVTAAVVAAVVLSGGPGAPSVADAAELATQAPTAAAPAALGTARTKLALAVEGVPFPDLTQFAGWRAVGARQSRIDGRAATVVFYRKDGRRIGYVIVAGAGLDRPSDARATVIRGVEYQALQVDGRPGVTWRRAGHTCILLGKTPRSELLRIASWPLNPRR